MPILYGTSTAHGTLTTACTMVTTTGASETARTSTIPATSLTWAEVLSQTGTSNAVSSPPATPTGKGWVYAPGAGTFAAANWSATVSLSGSSTGEPGSKLRFFKYNGSYTSIGELTCPVGMGGLKSADAFTAASMPATTFTASDLLYIDLWYFNDGANVGGDNPVVYVGNSSTQGVNNDMMVTTSTFTPGGKILIFDGLGGVFS